MFMLYNYILLRNWGTGKPGRPLGSAPKSTSDEEVAVPVPKTRRNLPVHLLHTPLPVYIQNALL